jgi:hypothetical protein
MIFFCHLMILHLQLGYIQQWMGDLEIWEGESDIRQSNACLYTLSSASVLVFVETGCLRCFCGERCYGVRVPWHINYLGTAHPFAPSPGPTDPSAFQIYYQVFQRRRM